MHLICSPIMSSECRRIDNDRVLPYFSKMREKSSTFRYCWMIHCPGSNDEICSIQPGAGFYSASSLHITNQIRPIMQPWKVPLVRGPTEQLSVDPCRDAGAVGNGVWTLVSTALRQAIPRLSMDVCYASENICCGERLHTTPMILDTSSISQVKYTYYT